MNGNQASGPPALSLVVNKDRDEELRRYAQSTSGLTSSQRIFPPDSRSMSMAKDSRMRSPAETALRKYPTDVPQRLAKVSCSATESEFKKTSTDFMAGILPDGKISSIPDRKLRKSKRGYASGMDITQLRAKNFLEILRTQYGDSPAEFERATGYSANMVTQIRNGHKKVSDKIARTLERAMGKPQMALDQPSSPESVTSAAVWPFSVSQAIFETLPPIIRADIDRAVTRLVLGAQAQEMAARQPKSPREKKSRGGRSAT